jgi:hypothetical protein
MRPGSTPTDPAAGGTSATPPFEGIHAGKECPTCAGKSEHPHITQVEMKNIMKQAVDTVYKLPWLKQNDPQKYDITGYDG